MLTDYTNGMIIALANSYEEAIQVIDRDGGAATWQHEGKERVFNFPKEPSVVIEIHKDTAPRAWTCWGGG